MNNPEGINTGSTIAALYGERQVRVFPVLETELSNISYMNILSTIFFGIGSFLIEKSIDFSNYTVNHKSVYFLGSFICFFIFLVTITIRWHTIHKIKKQTSKMLNL
jgi:hypothetical protein